LFIILLIYNFEHFKKQMADFKEEAYVLEKMEISEDDDDGFEYKEIRDSDEEPIEDLALESLAEDDDDLNDFTTLKAKTDLKKMAATQTRGSRVTRVADAVPKTLNRDVVIDDFIRNFL